MDGTDQAPSEDSKPEEPEQHSEVSGHRIGEMPYYGTKRVSAWPEMKNGFKGMGVRYEDGYISWSPRDVFDEAYQSIEAMSFGHALKAMKDGYRVCRAGWNGKGMWIVFMSGMTLPSYNTQGTEKKVNDRTAKWIGRDTPLETLPYFAMWTADKKWLPGWLASQSDMNANDWQIVE